MNKGKEKGKEKRKEILSGVIECFFLFVLVLANSWSPICSILP